jgi:hypothetical protein
LQLNLFKKKCIVKRDVEKIFVASREINMTELKDLFTEIKDKNLKTVRYFNEEETTSLRKEFEGISDVALCSKKQVDRLIEMLSPFKKIEHVFIYNLPLKRGGLREKSFEQMRKRVYACHLIHNTPISDKTWPFYLVKEITSRYIPSQTIIPHQDGYYFHFTQIQKDGAWIHFFKSVQEGKKAIVAFKGTTLIPGRGETWKHVWDTIKDDARPCMGTAGAMATADDVQRLLSDPKEGLVRSRLDHAIGIGNSLGALHLQNIAVTYPQKFSEIITVCSPGISKQVAEIYAGAVQKLSFIPKITHLFEQKDVMPEFGDVHLGYNCTLKDVEISVHHIEAVTSQSKLMKAIRKWKNPCPDKVIHAVRVVKEATFGPHLHPAIGRTIFFDEGCSNKKEEYREELQKLLAHEEGHRDPSCDKLRLRASRYFYPKDNTEEFVQFIQNKHAEQATREAKRVSPFQEGQRPSLLAGYKRYIQGELQNYLAGKFLVQSNTTYRAG